MAVWSSMMLGIEFVTCFSDPHPTSLDIMTRTLAKEQMTRDRVWSDMLPGIWLPLIVGALRGFFGSTKYLKKWSGERPGLHVNLLHRS
jgi:hypothetical protein